MRLVSLSDEGRCTGCHRADRRLTHGTRTPASAPTFLGCSAGSALATQSVAWRRCGGGAALAHRTLAPPVARARRRCVEGGAEGGRGGKKTLVARLRQGFNRGMPARLAQPAFPARSRGRRHQRRYLTGVASTVSIDQPRANRFLKTNHPIPSPRRPRWTRGARPFGARMSRQSRDK